MTLRRSPRVRPIAALARTVVLAGFPLCGAALAQTATPAPEAALPTVTVQARQDIDVGPQLDRKASGGALGNRTQLETPFSTTVVTGEDLADRGVTKIGDVFFNDASVTDNSNPGNAWASYTTVRGLQLDWRNAYKINGMPFIAYGLTMPYEQLEQVELLKGASGFMYGFGNPGGTVNYVTKKPTEQFTASVDLGYRSSHVWTEHVDIGGRAGPDNMFGYRLNLTHEEGKPSNAVGLNRNTVSLGLDARITRDLTWTFDGIYQDRNTWGGTPSFYVGSIAANGQLPGTISGRGGLYAGNDAHFFSNLQVYQTGLRYRLNDDWTVSTTYSFSKQSRTRNESTFFLSNAAGDYTDLRYDGSESQQFTNWTTMVEGKFRTGFLRHELVAGLSWQEQIDRYSSNYVNTALPGGNLFAPYVGQYWSQWGMTKYRAGDTTQKAAFVSDTIHITDKWSVLGGLRVTNYEQNGYGTPGSVGADTNYTKHGLLTPTAAIMFKPMPSTMLYASYVESFDGGGIVSSFYSNAGQALTPAKSRQYEVGAKTEQGIWNGTAALFRIEQRTEYGRDAGAGTLPVFVQDGKSIYQGVELAAGARIGSQWEVGGSAMYLDSYYDQGQANIGNRVAGAPNLMLTGRLAYRVPLMPGLKVGIDGKYTSTVKARPEGDLTLGGYTIFNLGATYNTRIAGKEVTLRAALSNLTNKRYWGFQYANYIQPADPRAVSLSAKISY
ncbi:TonB-dependent siderophore receptor [Cupriavidus plantarum]|uniref:TonB-dependent siderophore receptor n=1 Tax=Cupriavidus plantarum TaxID=942865 RepID=UPI000EB16DFE|nr:TonB-dependent receptor [Cupriavidus plantarum]RLK45446.1 iron complex outermembrane receptor protein [Cupriavidus plantarum]